jgi:transposase
LPKLASNMEEQTTKRRHRKYDAAFKEEVLRMAFDGRPVSEISQALGVGENLIYRWKSRHKAKGTKGENKGVIAASADQQALQKKIRELETERDILKKALAIFSRDT